MFTTAKGIQVWLLERHTLPVVSVTLAVPHGSARDPEDKPGLAYIAAGMLDEGAGKRNALELSSAVNDLGATLSVDAGVDGASPRSRAEEELQAGCELLADVVARPRFDARSGAGSHCWQNDLAKRADDPRSVSRVASSAAVYARGRLGHPSDGLLRGARRSISRRQGLLPKHWRPESSCWWSWATSRAPRWSRGHGLARTEAPASAGPAPPVTAPESKPPAARPRPGPRRPARRAAVRDRRRWRRRARLRPAGAAARRSTTRSEARSPHASTRTCARTTAGPRRRALRIQPRFADRLVRARAAVHTEVTGPALKEMLREIDKMASEGLTADELKRSSRRIAATWSDLRDGERHIAPSRPLASLGSRPVRQNGRGGAQGAHCQGSASWPGAPAHEGGGVIVVGPRTRWPGDGRLGLGEPSCGTPRAPARLLRPRAYPRRQGTGVPAKAPPAPPKAAPKK